jgi:hypothetical protein
MAALIFLPALEKALAAARVHQVPLVVGEDGGDGDDVSGNDCVQARARHYIFYHGVSRHSIPGSLLRTFEKGYPFGWLGIMSETPPFPAPYR